MTGGPRGNLASGAADPTQWFQNHRPAVGRVAAKIKNGTGSQDEAFRIVVSRDLDNLAAGLTIPITAPRPFCRAATNTLTGGHPMTKYLHTMIRVSSLEDSIAFFEVLGLREIRRRPDEKGRYTNVFLAVPGDEAAAVELTYNWDPEPYTGGRNFGHLAYAVDNIYDTCSAFIAHGVTINRPPRDGRMAFVRTPDGISIELLQAGAALPPAEPWASMANTGSW
jgi:lactoylglutathione lyase